LIGSFTLREAWQLLFLVITIYCALIFVVAPSARVAVQGLLAVGAMSTLHWALGAVAIMLSVVTCRAAWGHRLIGPPATRVLRFCFVLAGVLVVAGLVATLIPELPLNIGEAAASAVERIYRYRLSVDLIGDPRRAFGIDFDPSRFSSSIVGLLHIYFAYLF